MRDLLVSVVRTIVPVVVGLIIATVGKAGIDMDPGELAPIVDALVVGGWYTAVRWAEQNWPPAGWLLGLPAAPHYDANLTRRD